MIVSVHIPKTAGNSFRVGLRQCFGDRFLHDETPGPGWFYRLSWQRYTMTARRARKLAAAHDVVHGHFIASKYSPLGDSALFCAFFREPTDRVISRYRQAHTIASRSSKARGESRIRNMELLQFASRRRQRSLYRYFLGGLPVERFAFVGITEEYELSLGLFRAIFGVAVPYCRRNVNEFVPDTCGSRERSAIAATQRENRAVYDAARRRFDLLCNRHLR